MTFAVRGRTAALSGVLAAGAALAVTELVAGLLAAGRSVFVAVGDAAIARTPGPVVRFAIATFGSANRTVLLASMASVIALLGALLGVAASRRAWVGPAGLAVFAVLGAAAGVADPLMPVPAAVAAPLVGAVAGAGALWWLLRSAPRRDMAGGAADDAGDAGDAAGPATPTMPGRGTASRRVFLASVAGTAGSAALLAVAGRSLQQRTGGGTTARVTLPTPTTSLPPPPAGAVLDVEGLAPLITPNEDFYRIDAAFTVPRIDPAAHTVRITGMVDRPLTLPLSELVELADTEADVTLACVSNEVGGHLVGTARWRGVPLADLLERAGVQAGATQIVGRSVDGWTGGFPVEAGFDGRPALVAVGMNGEPLPPRHGAPVRLVVAGLYGYVSDTKWLSEIELTTFEAFDAYWIPRGWAERGPIKTQSRIDVPKPGMQVEAGTVAVAGVAWAGERGVSAVEVSVDGGAWQPATLADELAPTTWRQWVLRWAAEPGEHSLRVRATDGRGELQTGEESPPAPDGATGHHTVAVTVV